MSSVNKWIGIGRLGQDPEIKFLDNGNVCNFSVACGEAWTKDGQKHERTEWVRIVAWGKLAEDCSQYLSKGRQVYIEGRLQTRQWEKNGEKRYTTEVVARAVVFLDSKSDNQQAPSGGGNDSAPGDDDVPF